MQMVLYPVLVLTGIGAVAAVLLVLAAKFMHVPTDERIDAIGEALPGANCGACGFAGCADYAAAIVKDGASTGLCVPGGDKASIAIAAIMGTEAIDIEEKVALVRCSGSYNHTADKYNYTGAKSCAAASTLYGGSAICSYGCLGYGDCQNACPFGAIHVENGLAVVDQQICTGCGACAKVCPKNIIEIVPLRKRYIVTCLNHDKGGVTRKICSKGCIGCGRCAKACEFGAIVIEDNRAHISFDLCTACGKCSEVCPVGCIELIIHDQQPLERLMSGN